MLVNELVGADAGAVSKVGVATRAPAVAFFVWRFAVIGAAAEFGHVAEVGDLRPVGLEDERRIRVHFRKRDGGKPSRFKAERETTNTAE